MSRIEISSACSGKERAAFIKFPWRIYASDPAWVPPLIIERNEFLDRKKHPFYRHGDAALFLAKRGGEIVGRIMTSDDPNYNALHQTNVGCFGLFECIDDVNVASALFDAAEGWLREALQAEKAETAGTFYGIAGAASGVDLLFHEVCKELGVPTKVCLPIPIEDYRRESVADGGPDWVEKFNHFIAANPPVILSDSDESPEGRKCVHDLTFAFCATKIARYKLF